MAAMSRATRQIVVAHLTDRGMNPAQIASELAVSVDTVRRDLRDATPATTAETSAVAAPPAAGLLLPETPQTTRDLTTLAAHFKAQRKDVARFAIHFVAQDVRRRRQAALGAKQNA